MFKYKSDKTIIFYAVVSPNLNIYIGCNKSNKIGIIIISCYYCLVGCLA